MKLCFLECVGHSDVIENGSSGDTSDDFIFDLPNSHKSESSVQKGAQINVDQEKDYSVLWSNSSRYSKVNPLYNYLI